jgi:prevent-host-death family protein
MGASNTTKHVGARELKTRLGKYLKAVQLGSTITITERGVPVARLSPLPAHTKGIEGLLDALESQGLVSRGTGEPLGQGRAIKLRGEPIDRTISRERDDRL